MMRIGISKKHLILGTAALGLVTVGVLAGTASAQTPEPGTDGTSQSAVTTVKDKFLSRVASILGVEEAKLEEAMQQAHREIGDEQVKAHLDRAVAGGRMTQEQADEMYAWLQARPEGVPGIMGGPGKGRGMRGMPGMPPGGPGMRGRGGMPHMTPGFGGMGGRHGFGPGMFNAPPAEAPAPAPPAGSAI